MRLIQHKREAYWFYRFLSLGYDDWVNPLFWTPAMRERRWPPRGSTGATWRRSTRAPGPASRPRASSAAVDPSRVTMLDQSPHQLARAARRPALAGVRRLLGDAEALPFADDSFDRYVSAGSIEYWPDPQRGIAEAYRVLRAGRRRRRDRAGAARRPARPRARRPVDAVPVRRAVPDVVRARRLHGRRGDAGRARLVPRHARPYAVAVSGVCAGRRAVAARAAPVAETLDAPAPPAGGCASAARFAVGSLAGLAFVPIALAMTLRARRGRR